MKAVQISQYGGPEVLKLNDNIAEPTLKENQVLIEIHAASINPFDSFILAGYVKDMIKSPFPFTMGGDFSGIIKKVSEGVTDFKADDEVYGTAIILSGGSGAFAEFASVNPERMALKPNPWRSRRNWEHCYSVSQVFGRLCGDYCFGKRQRLRKKSRSR